MQILGGEKNSKMQMKPHTKGMWCCESAEYHNCELAPGTLPIKASPPMCAHAHERSRIQRTQTVAVWEAKQSCLQLHAGFFWKKTTKKNNSHSDSGLISRWALIDPWKPAGQRHGEKLNPENKRSDDIQFSL